MSDTNVTVLFSDVNTMWTLIGAALVFFMQAGFAAVEAGFTRSKNSGNIIMKNLMDFSIGTPLYWLVGFGIMFGTQSAVFGGIDAQLQRRLFRAQWQSVQNSRLTAFIPPLSALLSIPYLVTGSGAEAGLQILDFMILQVQPQCICSAACVRS